MSNETGQPIGRLEDFPPHRWTLVEVDGREVGVFNTGVGFRAVRNKCPHEGAPLCVQELTGTMLPSSPRRYEYGLHDRVLTCPWHGWQFDVQTGEMVFGTGTRRLSTYELRVQDGNLYISGPNRASEPQRAAAGSTRASEPQRAAAEPTRASEPQRAAAGSTRASEPQRAPAEPTRASVS